MRGSVTRRLPRRVNRRGRSLSWGAVRVLLERGKSMARPEKVSEVEVLKERLRRARAVVLTDFRGLTVGEINQLRGKLREAGVEYRVVKNRLMLIAAREAGIQGLEAKGGVMERRAVTAQEVRLLADLPPRGVLLALVAGGMRAPLYGLSNVLAGVPRSLVYVLDRIRQQRQTA